MNDVTDDVGERIKRVHDEVAQGSKRRVFELGGEFGAHDADSFQSLKAMKREIGIYRRKPAGAVKGECFEIGCLSEGAT